MSNYEIAARAMMAFVFAVMLAVSGSTPVLAASADKSALPKSIEIGGATVGGALHVLAGGLAKYLQGQFQIPVTAAVTEGTAENVRLIDRGEITFGGTSTTNGYWAYTGRKPFEKPFVKTRMLFMLYPHANPIVTRATSGIKHMRDLKGKRVGVGSSAAGWDALVGPLFEAHGIDYKKDIKRVYAGLGQLHTMVKDGLIDATITSIGADIPIPALSRLAAETKIVPVQFDDAALEKLAENPLHATIAIPKKVANQLFGMNQDIPTYQTSAMGMATSSDLNDDTAYLIVKTVYDGIDDLAGREKRFNYAKENPNFLPHQFGVPYHPGAVRFWKEAGLWGK